MTPWLVALMAAAGASGWVFSKLQQHSGYGNSRSAVMGTAVVFAVIFVVVLTVGLRVFH